MFVTVIAPKYVLLVSQWSCGHFLKLTDLVLFEWHDRSSPFNSTHVIPTKWPSHRDHRLCDVNSQSLTMTGIYKYQTDAARLWSASSSSTTYWTVLVYYVTNVFCRQVFLLDCWLWCSQSLRGFLNFTSANIVTHWMKRCILYWCIYSSAAGALHDSSQSRLLRWQLFDQLALVLSCEIIPGHGWQRS